MHRHSATEKSSVASSNSSIASIHGTHPNAHGEPGFSICVIAFLLSINCFWEDPAGEGHKKDPTRKLRGGDGATALGREIRERFKLFRAPPRCYDVDQMMYRPRTAKSVPTFSSIINTLLKLSFT